VDIESKKPPVTIPQTSDNVLLQTRSGALKNVVSQTPGLSTGWTWAAFFADIDNNTFQDLYVANGLQ
jgi:hypothetical protein